MGECCRTIEVDVVSVVVVLGGELYMGFVVKVRGACMYCIAIGQSLSTPSFCQPSIICRFAR